MRHSSRTALTALLALACTLAFAQISSAYWTSSSSGTGSGFTATLPDGIAPSASDTGTTVAVSIPQISLVGQYIGAIGGGYVVKRYPGAGGASATPGGTCSVLVTGPGATLNCSETSTPRGDWKYTVSPEYLTWTSAESGFSSTVVIEPDPASGLASTLAPAADIDLAWTAGTGATGYNVYRRTTAGSYNFASPVNGATPASGTTFTDTTSVSGTSYNYVVRSVVIGSAGQQIESANSNETAALVADGTNPTGVTLGAVPASNNDDLTLTGTANDTISGVAEVFFEYRTSSPVGAWTDACSETTSPYTCDFDTTSVADGLYDFRARAVDNAGNSTTSTIQTNRRIDNLDPVATATDPPAFVRGTISVGGTATDGGGIASLQLQFRAVGAPSWTTLCSSATSPISCSLNTTGYGAGQYELRLNVTDNAGNSGTDTSAPFTIDNNGPSVTMTALAAALSGTELLESTTGDAGSGMASVQYQYKLSSGSTWTNACNSASTPYSCNFNTGSVADGTYDFRAIASDALGNTTTSAAITNRVIDNSSPPAASLTNPGSPLRATVTLNATATDPGSGIANVQIQRSPAGLGAWTTICTDTTSPYSCSFDTTSVADGLYDLRAVATDNGSNQSFSAVVASRRIDNTAPAVALTSPGSPIRQTVTLNATSTDGGSGVAQVVFDYKLSSGSTWTTIATDTATPYSASFNTTALNGTYDLRATSTDVAGNTASSIVANIVIDNTVPSAADIQTANGSGTLGRPDSGDTITYTYSEAMQPTSILAGWTGASMAISVRLRNAGTDTIRIRTTGGTNLPLGAVRIGTAWVTATANFNATMVMSGNTIVVTLGTQTNGTVATSAANYTMRWNPIATPTDLAGNIMVNTFRMETGAADREF